MSAHISSYDHSDHTISSSDPSGGSNGDIWLKTDI
jgi:hypothetical protein